MTERLDIIERKGGPLLNALGVSICMVSDHDGANHWTCYLSTGFLRDLAKQGVIKSDEAPDYERIMLEMGVAKDMKELYERCRDITVGPGSGYGFTRHTQSRLAEHIVYGQITRNGVAVTSIVTSFTGLFNTCKEYSNERQMSANDALTILQQGIKAGLLLTAEDVEIAMTRVPREALPSRPTVVYFDVHLREVARSS